MAAGVSAFELPRASVDALHRLGSPPSGKAEAGAFVSPSHLVRVRTWDVQVNLRSWWCGVRGYKGTGGQSHHSSRSESHLRARRRIGTEAFSESSSPPAPRLCPPQSGSPWDTA